MVIKLKILLNPDKEIVKDWKCEIHSLSLSCYPMGRDILMKVFRFCLVMGI